MKPKIIYTLLGLVVLLLGCNQSKTEGVSEVITPKSGSSIKYAKRFAIEERSGYRLLYLFGNRHSNDTTTTFLVYTDTLPALVRKGFIPIKVPCKKIAALSSIYARMFYELGAIENLAAIDNIDYITCEAIVNKHKQGTLAEISKGIEINIEQTIALKPDIILTFGMGDWEKDRNRKVEQTKIPIAVSVDHLEQSPLARAEWIKFFAAFVNKNKEADSIFNLVEKNYLELKTLAQNSISRPSVFNEIKYSDSWYMPGGKSYMAQILEDAGANYLWKDNAEFGSLPLSFEQVYAKAKEADYWINLSTLNSKKELLAFEKRYAEFKSYKTGNLFNNNKITNAKGYSVYWESAMIFPDRILSDLIRIFHPEMKTESGHELYYYKKLE